MRNAGQQHIPDTDASPWLTFRQRHGENVFGKTRFTLDRIGDHRIHLTGPRLVKQFRLLAATVRMTSKANVMWADSSLNTHAVPAARPGNMPRERKKYT